VPTIDNSAAFAAAWEALQARGGGDLIVPPGSYLLGSTWAVARDLVLPFNFRILGYGARLYATTDVETLIEFSVSYNEFRSSFEGFEIDMRGNEDCTLVLSCLGVHNHVIRDITVEFYHAVKTEFTFIQMETVQPGASADTYNCFWNTVEHCSIRKRSGAEAGEATNWLRMIGACNATKIRYNQIQQCEVGILMEFEPTGSTSALPNGVIVEGNDFETISDIGVKIVPDAGELMITGLRLINNRVEVVDKFLVIDTGGAAPTQHSTPPLLMGNYYTTGSVTTVVTNTHATAVSVFDTKYPGFGPAEENVMYLGAGHAFVFTTGGVLWLKNTSGTASHVTACLKEGTYNLWVNPATDKFMLKSGTPANGADGTIVGTQS
jgi:hypothetical protein